MVDDNRYLEWAQSVIDLYEGKLSRMFGLPVPDVKVKYNAEQESYAYYDYTTGTIFLNPKYKDKNDPGGIVHELVHAFTGAQESTPIVEALADYARMQLGLTYEGWTPSAKVERLSSLSPQQVRAISQKIAQDFGVEPSQPATAEPAGTTGTEGGVGHPPGGLVNFGAVSQGGGDTGLGLDIEGQYQDLLEEQEKALKQQKREARIAEHREERALKYSFLGLLSEWGVSTSSNLDALVQQAADKHYSTDTFIFYLRQTPEYHRAFPGIFDKRGELKMSEAQYLSNREQFQAIAAQSGINLGPKQEAMLFRNDKSPAEFQQVAPAVGRLKRNPELFQQFSRELVQGGVAKAGDVTKRNLLRFAAGIGNKAWTDLWQDAATRYAAVEAGIRVKQEGAKRAPGAILPQGLIEKISGKGLTEAEMTAGFQQVAEHLLTTMPLSKIQGYGLSKKALTQAAFGGPRQAQVRQTIERILKQEEAFYQERAGAEFRPESQGLGRSQVQ